MLGESIETSAGDPTKAGQAKREVGTNPFIVGPVGMQPYVADARMTFATPGDKNE